MKKLIVFDVDGVLLDNKTGGFKDILVLLGKEKEVQVIDGEYQRRKHLGPWGLEELANLYRGLSKEKLESLAREYCQKHLTEGAKETVGELKEKNYLVGALSSNPQFIMDVLAGILDLDFVCGTQLEFKDDIATGKISEKVDRYKKAEILEEKMEELNLERREITVIGDSLTDLPMAEIAGRLFAFNAKKELKERADVVIEKKDLREVLKYI